MRVITLCVLLLVGTTPAWGEPITAERLDGLASENRALWHKYLERSQAAARADKAAIDAEIASYSLPSTVQAPSGGDFKLPTKPGDAWYASEEARQLADTILSYQTPTGGWSKHTGYKQGPRKPGMQWTSQNKPDEPAHYVATFDNGSTTGEIYFLAHVWNATKRDDCKAAVVKGLDFILAAQFPNGGWPQVYPLEGVYHDDITFNDDAMTHVLEVLRDIGNSEPCFAFLDDVRRAKAAEALASGIRCVLSIQIEREGKRTVWCAQYDALTLQPTAARAMEPATLSGTESAHILEFLMSIRNPSPEIIADVESGLAWLEQAKVTGIVRTKRDGKTVYVPDSASSETYWARFYDLKNGKPIFPGRDGVIYDTYEAMAAKNEVGYDYYSTQPGSILNTGQKKWRKMLAQQPKK